MLVFPRWVERAFDVTVDRLHHANARHLICRRRHPPFLLFAFVRAFQDRRAPWYLCGLIRKPLAEIGVILLHDVEHCFLGEIAMVVGK
jgi:hypothetical protein